MRWTEGHVHLVMRRFLTQQGWQLVAGEFPGGSDHELYPLNVVDPAVARDESPDPKAPFRLHLNPIAYRPLRPHPDAHTRTYGLFG